MSKNKKNTTKKFKKNRNKQLPVRVNSKKTVYHSPWFSIEKLALEQIANGYKSEYYVLRRPRGFVAIIAQNEQGRIAFVKQFRPTIMQQVYELPMGGIEKGETALQAAKREFLEETGFKAGSWQKIGQFYVGTGHTDQQGSVFLAQQTKKHSEAQMEPGEMITQLRWFNLSQLSKEIDDGKIKNGPSMAALFLAWPKLNKHINR